MADILKRLSSETLEDRRTPKAGAPLDSTAKPFFVELQDILEQFGDDLPEAFYGLRDAVRKNLLMIDTIGGEARLDSAISSWWQRIAWLECEMELLNFTIHDFGHAAAELSETVQGWRRLFIERAANGIPNSLFAQCRAPKRQIAPYEILSPVRLIGAELFLTLQQIQHASKRGVYKDVDLARFENHITVHLGELAELEKSGKTDLDITGAISDLDQLKSATRRWSNKQVSDSEFRDASWQIFWDLSAKTTLADTPQARQLNLSVLEFNSEYSGLYTSLIPLLEGIDRGLLIDPSLRRPQNGIVHPFRYNEAEALIRSHGCRVFLLQMGVETIGYYVFVPNPPCAIMPTQTLISDLVRCGAIESASSTRYGFFRGVGITKAARAQLNYAGARGYRILDHQMAQTALYEGCTSLICTVRGGENANTAKTAHLSVGWKETGFEIRTPMHANGATLEVLHRDTRQDGILDASFVPPIPSNWGCNPHYRPYTAMSPLDPAFLNAAPISDYAATTACVEFARKINPNIEVLARQGSLAFYISFQETLSHFGSTIHLHQQRPRCDVWFCTHDNQVGTLQDTFRRLEKAWNPHMW